MGIVTKEVVTTVRTSNNKEINIGDMVAFNAGGKTLYGRYAGISKQGALMFDSQVGETSVKYNVMPNSIDKIYLAEVGFDI